MPFQGTTHCAFISELQLPGQPSNSSASSVQGDREEEHNLILPTQYVPAQDATSQIAEQLSSTLNGWQLAFSSMVIEAMVVEKCNGLLPLTANLGRNIYIYIYIYIYICTHVCVCGFVMCILNI